MTQLAILHFVKVCAILRRCDLLAFCDCANNQYVLQEIIYAKFGLKNFLSTRNIAYIVPIFSDTIYINSIYRAKGTIDIFQVCQLLLLRYYISFRICIIIKKCGHGFLVTFYKKTTMHYQSNSHCCHEIACFAIQTASLHGCAIIAVSCTYNLKQRQLAIVALKGTLPHAHHLAPCQMTLWVATYKQGDPAYPRVCRCQPVAVAHTLLAIIKCSTPPKIEIYPSPSPYHNGSLSQVVPSYQPQSESVCSGLRFGRVDGPCLFPSACLVLSYLNYLVVRNHSVAMLDVIVLPTSEADVLFQTSCHPLYSKALVSAKPVTLSQCHGGGVRRCLLGTAQQLLAFLASCKCFALKRLTGQWTFTYCILLMCEMYIASSCI